MSKALLLPALLASLLASPSPHALAAGDLDTEYTQVRKIALKDPKVQAAYAKADQRLSQKMLEIDPALQPVIARHPSQQQQPLPATHPSPPFHHTTASGSRQHIVTQGETLGAIAQKYHVKIATLKSANHITDERKLQVGQKLAIPAQ